MIAQPNDESLFEKQYDFSRGQIAFGKFEIVKPIGSGGMGDVYEAYYSDLKRAVALKVLHKTNDASTIVRFQNEARLSSSLHHSGIATIYDIGKSKDGRLYMSMELVQGTTLQELIEKEGRLSIQETIEIVIHVAHALAHAHKRGVVHRDIKPANIMIVEDPNSESRKVKVLDFGIAKKFDTENGGAQALTKNRLSGSPIYMSPEQCRQEAVAAPSDLYSLGCVMFECLSGRAPFHGATAMETLLLHQNGAIPKLEDTPGVDADAEIANLLNNLLAKDPKDRLSARKLTEILESIYDDRFGHKIVITDSIELPQFDIRSGGTFWGSCIVGILVIIGVCLAIPAMFKVDRILDENKKASPSVKMKGVQSIVNGEDSLSIQSVIERNYFGAAPNDGDEALKKLTPNILKVDLEDSKITDEGLRELRRIKVHELHLGFTKIKTLKHIGLMPSLNSLSIEKTAMGDSALEEVIKQFPELEEINVRESEVTAAKVDELLSKVHSMRRVDLLPCNRISYKDLKLLRLHHPLILFDNQTTYTDDLCDRGRKFTEMKKYVEAEQVYRQALESVDPREKPELFNIILLQHNVALQRSGKLKESHDGYAKQARFSMTLPKGSVWVALAVNHMLDTDRKMKEYKRMEADASEWLPIVKQKCGPNSLDYAAVLRRYAESIAYNGHADDAITQLGRCVKILEKHPVNLVRDELSSSHAMLGNIYFQRKNPKCQAHWRLSLESLGNTKPIIRASLMQQIGVGILITEKGPQRFSDANEVIEQSCRLSESMGDRKCAGETRARYGEVLLGLRRFREGIDELYKAKQIFTQFKARPRRTADCLVEIATAYQRLKEWRKSNNALAELKSIIPKIQAADQRDGLLTQYFYMSVANNTALNDQEAAIGICSEMIAKNSGTPAELVDIHVSRGDLYFIQRQFDEAMSDYQSALVIAARSKDRLRLQLLHYKIGTIYQAKSELSDAVAEYKASLASSPDKHVREQDRTLINHVRVSMSQCLIVLHRLSEAEEQLDIVLADSSARKDHAMLAHTEMLRAHVALGKKDVKRALEFNRRAVSITPAGLRKELNDQRVLIDSIVKKKRQ